MEKMKVLFAAGVGILAAYLQKYYLLYILVAVAVMMDLVSGMAAAVVSGQGLSSKVARNGFVKKMMMLFAVGFGTFLDVLLPYATGSLGIELETGLLVSAVISVYICIGESISIMENIYRATGKQPPALIRKLLEQAKEKIDGEY